MSSTSDSENIDRTESVVGSNVILLGKKSMREFFIKYLNVKHSSVKCLKDYLIMSPIPSSHKNKFTTCDELLGYFGLATEITGDETVVGSQRYKFLNDPFSDNDFDLLFFYKSFHLFFSDDELKRTIPSIEDLKKWRNDSQSKHLEVSLKQMCLKFILFIEEIASYFRSCEVDVFKSDIKNILKDCPVHNLIATILQIELVNIVAEWQDKSPSNLLFDELKQKKGFSGAHMGSESLIIHDDKGAPVTHSDVADTLFSQKNERHVSIIYGELGFGKTTFINNILILKYWCFKTLCVALKKLEFDGIKIDKLEEKLAIFISKDVGNQKFCDDLRNNCSDGGKFKVDKVWEYLLDQYFTAKSDVLNFWRFIMIRFYTICEEFETDVDYCCVIPIDLNDDNSEVLHQYLTNKKSFDFMTYFENESMTKKDFLASRVLLIVDGFNPDIKSNTKFLTYCLKLLPNASIILAASTWHRENIDRLVDANSLGKLTLNEYFIKGVPVIEAITYVEDAVLSRVSPQQICNLKSVIDRNARHDYVSPVTIETAVALSILLDDNDFKMKKLASFPSMMRNIDSISNYPCNRKYSAYLEGIHDPPNIADHFSKFIGYKKFLALLFLVSSITELYPDGYSNVDTNTVIEEMKNIIQFMNIPVEFFLSLWDEFHTNCSQPDSVWKTLWKYITQQMCCEWKNKYRKKWVLDSREFEEQLEWLGYFVQAEMLIDTIRIHLSSIDSSKISKVNSVFTKYRGKVDINIVVEKDVPIDFSLISSEHWVKIVSFKGWSNLTNIHDLKHCSETLRDVDVKLKTMDTYTSLIEKVLPELTTLTEVQISVECTVTEFFKFPLVENAICYLTLCMDEEQTRDAIITSMKDERNAESMTTLRLYWTNFLVSNAVGFVKRLEAIPTALFTVDIRAENISEKDKKAISAASASVLIPLYVNEEAV